MNFLNKYKGLSPSYDGGLTNHLPMVITALKQMNVAENDIDNFISNYLNEKDIPYLHQKQYPISDFDESYINKTNLYLDELTVKKRDTVLKEFFKIAKYSLSSGLFHGLIRLYYAVLEDNDTLIAQALAYFELLSNKIILKGTYKSDTLHFETLLNIKKTSTFTFKTYGSMSKLNELIEKKEIISSIFSLNNITSKEDQLLDLFLTQYLKTRDFYILHVITGFHALIELKQFIDDYQEVLEQYFYVAQLFMLMNEYEETYPNPVSSNLEELKKMAFELTDAHDIKLFFTILRLSTLFENNKCNQIATVIFEKEKK
jgi:hypothetical protein